MGCLVLEVLSWACMLLWFSSLVPYFLQKPPSCPTSSSACMAESESQSARSSPPPGSQGLLAPPPVSRYACWHRRRPSGRGPPPQPGTHQVLGDFQLLLVPLGVQVGIGVLPGQVGEVLLLSLVPARFLGTSSSSSFLQVCKLALASSLASS